MTRRESGFLAAVLLMMLGAQCINLNAPLLRHHESMLTQFGKQARNQLRFGAGVTRFGLLNTTGPRLDAYENYREHFYHHPALPGQVLALGFMFGGESERTMRVVGMMLAVLGVFAFLWLVTELGWHGSKRMIAVAAFALNPSFVYYSIVAVNMTLVVGFGIAACAAYLRWRGDRRPRWLAVMFAALFLGSHSDWQIYYVHIAIALHLFFDTPRRVGLAMLVLAAGPLFFGTFILHLLLQDASTLEHMLRALRVRQGAGAGVAGYVMREGLEIGKYFGVLVLLALYWVVRIRRERFILCLAALLLDEVWLFGHAYGHSWSTYPGIPFFVLAAVSGGEDLLRRISFKRTAVAVVAALFCATSVFMLRNRLTKFGAYEFYYKMALAAREVSLPEDRIGIVTHDEPHYSRYYLDRYAITYLPPGTLQVEGFAGISQVSGFEEALKKFEEQGVRYVVAAGRHVVEHVAFMRGLTDEQLKAFGVESEPVRVLASRFEATSVRGFTIFDLKRRKVP